MNRRMFMRRSALVLPAVSLGAGGLSASTALARSSCGEAAVTAWVEAYLEAWRMKDGDAAAHLFAPNAIYQALPGVAEQTYVGRDAIRAYWNSVTAPQQDIETRHGTPVVPRTGPAAVELWVHWRDPAVNPDGNNWVTLIEANFLEFDREGLCTRNVEYWNFLVGRVEPPDDWGFPS